MPEWQFQISLQGSVNMCHASYRTSRQTDSSLFANLQCLYIIRDITDNLQIAIRHETNIFT